MSVVARVGEKKDQLYDVDVPKIH